MSVPMSDRVDSPLPDGPTPVTPGFGSDVDVELTADGYLRMSAEVAARWFTGDALVAVARDGELWLMPLHSTAGGGLLLKQRNRAGDRSALVLESLPEGFAVGIRPGFWDEANGVLRVALTDSAESIPAGESVRRGDRDRG